MAKSDFTPLLLVAAGAAVIFFWPVIASSLDFKRQAAVKAQADYLRTVVPQYCREYASASPARRIQIRNDMAAHGFLPCPLTDDDCWNNHWAVHCGGG
jgi:hypothetical protein